MCITEPITLQNNPFASKVKLGLRLIYSGFGFSVTNIEAKVRQYNLIGNDFVEEILYISHQYVNNVNYMYGSQSIILDDADNDDGMQFYWTLNKFVLTSETVFKGI